MARRNTEEQGKIFVGGLSWETTQDGLLNYFSRFGEVVDSVVMCNETGRSRGFGFVTFRDPSCVATVLAGGPHQLDGRTVDPKSCNPRSASRPMGGGGGGGPPSRGGGGGGGSGRKVGSTTKIFIGGLPASVNEAEVHSFFSEYGKVVEAIIMYDQEQKRSRGFGFVTFETEDPVHQLTGQRYVEMGGKQVECKRAEPKESRPPKVGGGRGGGWGGQQGGGGGSWGGNQWGAPNGGGPQSYGNQGYSGGYNSWGGAQSGGYNSGGGGGGYGNYGSGDQSYSGYGSYGQQTSSYGPMRNAGGYGDNSYNATGYNGAAGNGVAAPAAAADGGQGYHPYRR